METKQNNAFIVLKNGGKGHHETTKGWGILLWWKDGSSIWEPTTDMKECYSIQLAKYAHLQHILQEPAFAWWVPQTLKKRNCIIAKEMKNICITFEVFGGHKEELLPGYQEVKYHMIFDIKMGKNFQRKARM
eukprot:4821851-Ditylum_brightwellii.AAC.1